MLTKCSVLYKVFDTFSDMPKANCTLENLGRRRMKYFTVLMLGIIV